MLTVKTTLARSSFHGLGLFAAEAVASGGILWRNVPELDQIFPTAVAHALPEPARSVVLHYGYRSLTLPGAYILEFDDARFMNHSDAPNTRFVGPDCGFAIRDIAPGDEITCDYREFYLPEDLGFLAG